MHILCTLYTHNDHLSIKTHYSQRKYFQIETKHLHVTEEKHLSITTIC